jgi:hypothetical protein
MRRCSVPFRGDTSRLYSTRPAALSASVLILFGCTRGNSPTETGRASQPGGVEWGDEVCCDQPTSGFDRLREEGVARGLDFEIEDGGVENGGNINGGISTGDMDRDGDLDLIFGSLDTRPKVYLNDGSGFFEALETPEVGLQALFGTLASQHSVIDVDGDGWLDIIQIGLGAVWIYWNRGDLSFSDPELLYQEKAWPKPQLGTMAWGDMDADGDLDLLVTGLELREQQQSQEPMPIGHPEILLRNEGGTFEVVAELSPDGTSGVNITATFTDRDNDGDQDLFVPADLGQVMADYPPSAFYRNDGLGEDGLPIWINDAPQIGADVYMSSMGLVTGDWNDDGELDYCISDIGPILCLLSQEDGSYYDGGVALGLQATSSGEASAWSGWGIEIADLDNDGLEDAVAAGGQPIGGFSGGRSYPDVIWQGVRGDQARFLDVTHDVEFGSADDHYGLVTADFDGDGWLEVVLAGVPGPPLYWQNRCGEEAWVSLELVAPAPNWQAFGARVELSADDMTWTRELQNVHAMSQHSTDLHYGLGSAEQVDALRIRWPDGAITELEDLPIRRKIRITHPDLVD